MKIDHLGIGVRVLEAMRTFYSTYFNAIAVPEGNRVELTE